jgi:1,2-diacylglycerol 3-alpha-glucosyltransferase
MKIGFFTDSYLSQPDGVASSVTTSVKALRAAGHDVYVVTPKNPKEEPAEKVFRLTSIKVYDKPEYRFAVTLPEKPMRDILKINFDVIHGHFGGPVSFLGWQVAFAKNIPFVATYHTLLNRYTHYILKGTIFTPKVANITSRVICNLCDAVIVPSESVKKELLSYGVRKPITVVPSGIDLAKFQNIEKGYLRQKIGLGDGAKIILYVGRLGREKSVDFLMRSFKQVSSKNPDAYLVLVGDGPDRSKLKELAKKLGLAKRTIFTGFIEKEDMPKVYADSDLFVFASQTETQGLAVPEALVSGLPVVVVRDPAFEGVVKSGENGFLVGRDETQFANKVIKLLGDANLRKNLSARAKSTAEKFSADHNAKKLAEIYEKLIIKNKEGKLIKGKLPAHVMGQVKTFFSYFFSVNKLKNIINYVIFTGNKNGS